MKTLDILTAPWAIDEARMTEIQNVYFAHLRGEKIKWGEMQAQFGLVFSEAPETRYEIIDDVAVIPVKGVLSKGASLLSWLFGGTAMKDVGQDFQAALEDPTVRSIILDIDSPGGTIDGTEELAEMIYAARGEKPIVAYSDGDMLSAAYWVGSAADRVYISGDTVNTGSIGVVATHVDYSEGDAKRGAKWTEVTSGKYKRLVSSHAPLDDEATAYLQEQVDYLAVAFSQTIARNRGLSPEAVAGISQGKIYIGQQGVNAGLVDGVTSFDLLIGQLTTKPTPQIIRAMVEAQVKSALAIDRAETKTEE